VAGGECFGENEVGIRWDPDQYNTWKSLIFVPLSKYIHWIIPWSCAKPVRDSLGTSSCPVPYLAISGADRNIISENMWPIWTYLCAPAPWLEGLQTMVMMLSLLRSQWEPISLVRY
jgi:hypothetical protein